MDEIAEKQRQRERELEEKERLRREALLGRSSDGASKPYEPPARALEPGTAAPAAAAAAAAPTPGKYVPKHLRERASAEGAGAAPPQPDRWGSGGGRRSEGFGQAPPEPDRWGSSRRTEGSGAPPEADRWGSGSRPDDRTDRWRPGGGSRPSWSSSRNPPR